MPNLDRFARRGAWFREARSVFPSATRVATTSIATGAPPSVHGVVGNAFLFPPAIRDRVGDTSRLEDLALAEAATDGRFVTAPTFADALAAHGKRLAIVHTGSAGSAYLLDPKARANGHWTYSVLRREHTPTPEAVDEVRVRLGGPPPRTLPRFGEIDHAATVLLEHVLAPIDPDVALVWFNEPDTSYHHKGIGAADAAAVLRHVDAAFGRILDVLERRPDADRFAILAASDHGQITTVGEVDLAGLLGDPGHRASRAGERVRDGVSLSLTGGGMGEIRVLDGGEARRDAVARWLAEQPFVGMLFSPGRNEVEGMAPGTFALEAVGMHHERRPDLAFVMRSWDEEDRHGLPGRCLMTGGVPVGGGMHGGLNRHELNTFLSLRAPGVEVGIDGRAASITEIAPTILRLLGLAAPPSMAGAGLLGPRGPVEAESLEVGLGDFTQRLSVARHDRWRLPVCGGRK